MMGVPTAAHCRELAARRDARNTRAAAAAVGRTLAVRTGAHTTVRGTVVECTYTAGTFAVVMECGAAKVRREFYLDTLAY